MRSPRKAGKDGKYDRARGPVGYRDATKGRGGKTGRRERQRTGEGQSKGIEVYLLLLSFDEGHNRTG